MSKYLWYFKLLLLCSIYLSAQGQVAWNELPISGDAQDAIKSNWDNAVGGVKEVDEITGQNMAENVEEIAKNAGISFSESPSPSPTMTPTPSVTPSSSPSPSLTPTSSPSETPAPSTTPTATPTPTKSASPTPFRNRRSVTPLPSPALVEVKQTIPEIDVPTGGTEYEIEIEAVLSDEDEEAQYEPPAVGDSAVVGNFKIDGPFGGEILPTGRQLFRERVLGKDVVRQSIGLQPQVKILANGKAIVLRRTESCTGTLQPSEGSPKVVTELAQVYRDKAGVKVVFIVEGPFGNACRILLSFEITTVRKLREGLLPSLTPISAPSRSPTSLPTSASPETSATPSASLSLPTPTGITSESPNPSSSGTSAPASPSASSSVSSSPSASSSISTSPSASLSVGASPSVSSSVSSSASASSSVSVSPSTSSSASASTSASSSALPSTTPSPSVSLSVSPSASPSAIIVPDNQHGMTCASHPAYFDGLRGVLVRSWKTIGNRDRYTTTVYWPRWEKHVFAPVSDLDSRKYENLDLMRIAGTYAAKESQILYLKFTRPAKVYLFYMGDQRGFREMTFEDWTSEGWAQLKRGSLNQMNIGIVGEVTFQVSKFAYVFSKHTVNDEIVLPGGGYMADNVSGPPLVPYYWVFVAEADGSASVEPLLPDGVSSIAPGQRCPDSLHDLWVAPARPDELDVANEKFETVHPLWDPCYWCAYTHEHGSIPFDAMNWYPRLDYVSFKNNENESREGHKGYMIRSGDYLFYYGLHAHVSQSRRFFTRFHTVIFVVVDANTKEKLLEISHKGDFGFCGGRAPPNGRSSIPVNLEDAAIWDEISKTDIRAQKSVIRLVNVNDPRNRDPTFAYRNLENLLSAFYEKWKTFPTCSDGNGILEVDITNPSTALKEKGEGNTEMTKLGIPQDDNPYEVKYQNPSTERLIRAFGFNFSADFCNFEMPDSTGVFYTSPDGLTLKSGPGPNNVRQYIKPGFSFSLRGIYRPNDTFVGMHFQNDDAINAIYDIGRAIDPNIN